MVPLALCFALPPPNTQSLRLGRLLYFSIIVTNNANKLNLSKRQSLFLVALLVGDKLPGGLQTPQPAVPLVLLGLAVLVVGSV